MADYHKSKRKRVRDIKSHISVPKNNIKMTPGNEKENLKVIHTRKAAKKVNRLICSGIALFLAVFLVVVNFLTPTGIIESAEVLFSTFKISKTADYISGTKTVDAYNQKNNFFVLTDTSLQSFTNGGR